MFSNFAKLIKKQRSLNLYQRGFSQLTLVLPAIILANDVLSGELEVGRHPGGRRFCGGAGSCVADRGQLESLSRFVAGIDRLHALSQVAQNTCGPTPWAEPPTSEDAAPAPHDGAQIITRGATPGPGGADAAHAAVWPSAGAGSVPHPGRRRRPAHHRPQRLRQSSRCCARWQGCGAGQGTVQHPPLADMFFLPQRPICSPIPLRSQIIYPSQATELTDDQLLELLDEVQLGSLAERVGGLNASHDWEKLLSTGEQQRLAFARVLARTPRIVILDEATSALDSANEAALYERLRATGMALVSYIAHRPAVLRHHTQVLQLKGDGAGNRWRQPTSASTNKGTVQQGRLAPDCGCGFPAAAATTLSSSTSAVATWASSVRGACACRSRPCLCSANGAVCGGQVDELLVVRVLHT